MLDAHPLTRSEAMACRYAIYLPVSGRILAASHQSDTISTACREVLDRSWDVDPRVIDHLRVLDRVTGRSCTLPEMLAGEAVTKDDAVQVAS